MDIRASACPASTNTVKLGFKKLLNKEQIGNSEPFPVTILPVYLIDNEQIGISEQFCDGQKVPYYQVWLYNGILLPLLEFHF